MITQTIIAAVLILFFTSAFSGLKESDIHSSIHLKEALKPYFSGEQKFLSQTIVEELENKNNMPLFNYYEYRLKEENNPNYSTLLSPLVTIFFDSDTIFNNHQILFAHLERSPELLNKGIFALKKVKPSSEDIRRISTKLENSWYVDPSERYKMNVSEWDGWCCINNLFFHRRYAYHHHSIRYMCRISKEEKNSYWKTALKPTFHADFLNRDTIELHRSKVKQLLLTFRRLRKEGAPIIDKKLICTCIVPYLFEDAFADFKNDCNTVEYELHQQIRKMLHIYSTDPEQIPFFLNFKEWYAQEKEECLKKLHTFETVKKILSYKIVE